MIQSESSPNASTIFDGLSPIFRNFPQGGISLFCVKCKEELEARVGIEPTNKGFADLCLTTWLPRRERGSKSKVPRRQPPSQSPAFTPSAQQSCRSAANGSTRVARRAGK